MRRSFVAVYPSAEAVEHLDEFLEVRRESGSFRWTLPTQWHLTRAFFDDVPDRSFDALVEGLAAAAGKTLAMRASIAGGGRTHMSAGPRCCGRVEATKWVCLLDAYGGPEWIIDEIALVESHLGEGPKRRPRHEVVAAFSFS